MLKSSRARGLLFMDDRNLIGQSVIAAKISALPRVLLTLSKDLTAKHGKGFSRSNLFQCRQLYLRFPKIQTVSGFLSWNHYYEILKSDNGRSTEGDRWKMPRGGES